MDFTLSDEQQMIRDTAATFLAEVSSSAAVRTSMQLDTAYDPALWQRICAELYWQAMHFPEQHGGLGLGYVELGVTLEQMGRYLLCSPFYATVCLAGNALLLAGSEAQQAEYLPKFIEGQTATLAYTGSVAAERGGRWGADTIVVEAEQQGENYVLNGSARYVVDGASADWLVVAARRPGTSAEDGVSLFIVDASLAGIERQVLPTMDQTRALAAISFDNLQLSKACLLGDEGGAWSKLESVLDLANIALAAEQLGGAQQCLDLAVDYAKERVQFNRPIAGFQAIKHMAADMMQRVEVARSGVYYALCVADQALRQQAAPGELAEAASIAKSYCSDAFFKNAADALQMHGGVGFTWEYDIQLYFKRAKATEHLLGNAAWHRERLAGMLLDAPSAAL